MSSCDYQECKTCGTNVFYQNSIEENEGYLCLKCIEALEEEIKKLKADLVISKEIYDYHVKQTVKGLKKMKDLTPKEGE